MIKTQHKESEYTLTFKEITLLINGIPDFRDRCILKCLYSCGMRASEVCKLKIEDIDFDRFRINIKESKGGKTRTIPVIDLTLLQDIKFLIGKNNTGLVFVSKKKPYQIKPMNRRNIGHITHRWGRVLRIKHPNPYHKGLNPHLFRHTAARHLKDLNYPVEFIQNFLGHASYNTTMNEYGTMSITDMENLINKKQKRIEEDRDHLRYLE